MVMVSITTLKAVMQAPLKEKRYDLLHQSALAHRKALSGFAIEQGQP
jgi:hypothetical protein